MKRHLSEYYPFYILAYGLVLPEWFHLQPLFLYRHLNLALPLLLLTIGVILVFFAGGLKHLQPKWKILDRALFAGGLVLQVVSLAKLSGPALSHVGVALAVAISLAMSSWWIVVYGLNLRDLNKERNTLIGKKVLTYFVLCAVLLYGPSLMLHRYYVRKISAISPAGPVRVPGGIDYMQIEKIMEETVWQAGGLLSLLTLLVPIVFFYFYRRAKNSVQNY